MKMSITKPQYRPVTIVLETQDDFDMFDAVLYAVSMNAVHIQPHVIKAARDMSHMLNHLEERD